MQKIFYQEEFAIGDTQKPGGVNKTKEVVKIQSGFILFDLANADSGTAIAIDGHFGQATEKSVMNLQKAKGLIQAGIVDSDLFAIMCEPFP